MIYVLLPLINLYVLFYLTNCMMKEEVFSKTAELVRDIFSWGAKLVLTIVVGLNVVQGMIAPAVDYASRTTLTKSLSLIPGLAVRQRRSVIFSSVPGWSLKTVSEWLRCFC